ncbi:MAG: T9SS type A sorting domain-containing protein [Ignavibacteria bacterium]|nr:T9SS type A sorting domain-containing protein [Ignavibacteria bacterium]
MRFKSLLNFLLLITFFCCYNFAAAGDRTVLVERFTSSTCGPCASNNPTVDAFMNSLTDAQIMGLSFHMNWPSPGNDPMYLYNVNDNTTRRTYYNVNAIPQLQMDGTTTLQPNYTSGQLTSAYNTRAALLSPVTIIVRQNDIGTDSIQVLVTVYCETAIANPIVNLQVAIMEKLIQYPSPPGTNGETAFHTVMRKMLPSATGTNLYITPGSRKDFEFRVKKDAIWNSAQLKAIAFIQAPDKEVLNSAWPVANFSLLPNAAFKVVNAGVSQNADYSIGVPYVANGYNSPVTFTASVIGNPAGINVTFPSGNVVNNFTGSGSVAVNVSSTSGVPAGIYQVVVTGTNGSGVSHKTVVNYNVGRSFFTTATNKQNLTFSVDGNSYSSSQLFTWDLNSSHTLSTTSPQVFLTTQYVFQNWSNGSTQLSQTINTNTSTSDYTANFKTQYKLTTTVSPGGMPVTISSGNQYWDENSTVALNVSATQVSYNGKTYYFQRWLGSGTNSYTGTNSTANLTMSNPISQIAIYDTINTAISGIGTEIPEKYNLYQNYPNPFNPATNIRFDLPSSSFTSLKVFDINGREVADLISQKLAAGKYEYAFNAASLASGVYYFKLVSGDFTQIKKMMLVK